MAGRQWDQHWETHSNLFHLHILIIYYKVCWTLKTRPSLFLSWFNMEESLMIWKSRCGLVFPLKSQSEWLIEEALDRTVTKLCRSVWNLLFLWLSAVQRCSFISNSSFVLFQVTLKDQKTDNIVRFLCILTGKKIILWTSTAKNSLSC